MSTPATDNRYNFRSPIRLSGSCSITLDIVGGPLGHLQVAIFDANDQLLNGVGTGSFGPGLTTENGGHVGWVFTVPQNVSYIKWGVQAVRSAPTLSYTATVNVCTSDGTVAAQGIIGSTIPNDASNDDIFYDGTFVITALASVPTGASTSAGA